LIDAAADIRQRRDLLIDDLTKLQFRLEACPTHAEAEEIMAEMDAYRERINDLWEEEAERKEVAARCYLIVRGAIGVLAWET
jgi:hypothetical protein